MSYSCPLCHAPLSRSDNHYSCPQRHQFDLAKEGYVNLLPVQFKRSRDPGDSAEMMQARRRSSTPDIISRYGMLSLSGCDITPLRIYWISAVARGITPTRCRHRQPQLGAGRVEAGDPRGGKTLSAGEFLRGLQPAPAIFRR